MAVEGVVIKTEYDCTPESYMQSEVKEEIVDRNTDFAGVFIKEEEDSSESFAQTVVKQEVDSDWEGVEVKLENEEILSDCDEDTYSQDFREDIGPFTPVENTSAPCFLGKYLKRPHIEIVKSKVKEIISQDDSTSASSLAKCRKIIPEKIVISDVKQIISQDDSTPPEKFPDPFQQKFVELDVLKDNTTFATPNGKPETSPQKVTQLDEPLITQEKTTPKIFLKNPNTLVNSNVQQPIIQDGITSATDENHPEVPPLEVNSDVGLLILQDDNICFENCPDIVTLNVAESNVVQLVSQDDGASKNCQNCSAISPPKVAEPGVDRVSQETSASVNSETLMESGLSFTGSSDVPKNGSTESQTANGIQTTAVVPITVCTTNKKPPDNQSSEFKRKNSRKQHLVVRSDEKPFFCDEDSAPNPLCEPMISPEQRLLPLRNFDNYDCHKCAASFKHISHLKKHFAVHVNDEQFSCKLCGAQFLNKDCLIRHEISHSSEKPLSCDKCSVIIHLNQQVAVVFKEPQVCKVCLAQFRNRFNLKQHMSTHHGDEYSCDQCSACFKGEFRLRLHLATHSDKTSYSCDQCSGCFINKFYLKLHSFTHSNKMIFRCDRCPAEFKRKHQLYRHSATHS